jgi:hypothetical protein
MTRSLLRCLASVIVAVVPLLLDSCSSTANFEGIPEKLPVIALNGTSATPPHTMQSFEYPFDSQGNYVSDWAAEGERRSGRPAAYTSDDERKWSGSHAGKVIASRKSTSKTSAKKKSSSKDDDPPAKKKTTVKSSTTPAKKSSSYTVKSSDTLYGIARKMGISVERLKKANGLKSDKIRPGASLTIPK